MLDRDIFSQEWSEHLQYITCVIEEMQKSQSSWLYLQPIFSCADIQRQLPEETKQFRSMENYLRDVTKHIKKDPKVIMQNNFYSWLFIWRKMFVA